MILWHDAWTPECEHLLGNASLSTFSWQRAIDHCWTTVWETRIPVATDTQTTTDEPFTSCVLCWPPSIYKRQWIREFKENWAWTDRGPVYVVYIHLITCKMQIVHTDKRLNTADWVWQTTDPSSRQRERPTSTNLQLSDSNKDLVVSSRWVLYSKTGWPTDRRS
jgi:hypothetical protein